MNFTHADPMTYKIDKILYIFSSSQFHLHFYMLTDNTAQSINTIPH